MEWQCSTSACCEFLRTVEADKLVYSLMMAHAWPTGIRIQAYQEPSSTTFQPHHFSPENMSTSPENSNLQPKNQICTTSARKHKISRFRFCPCTVRPPTTTTVDGAKTFTTTRNRNRVLVVFVCVRVCCRSGGRRTRFAVIMWHH
jgi:hypothetical protein